MTAFQICWLIAGAILGWTAPELLLMLRPKVNVPTLFNIGFAFVGGLIAYSIVR